jgi:hypothetical protein
LRFNNPLLIKILLLFLIEHHIMKAYGGMGVNVHAFSASVLFVDEGSDIPLLL